MQTMASSSSSSSSLSMPPVRSPTASLTRRPAQMHQPLARPMGPRADMFRPRLSLPPNAPRPFTPVPGPPPPASRPRSLSQSAPMLTALSESPTDGNSIERPMLNPWMLDVGIVHAVCQEETRKRVSLILGSPATQSIAPIMFSGTSSASTLIILTVPSSSASRIVSISRVLHSAAVRILRVPSQNTDPHDAISLVSILDWASRVAHAWRVYGDQDDVRVQELQHGEDGYEKQGSRRKRGLFARNRKSAGGQHEEDSGRKLDTVVNFLETGGGGPEADKKRLKHAILVSTLSRPYLTPAQPSGRSEKPRSRGFFSTLRLRGRGRGRGALPSDMPAAPAPLTQAQMIHVLPPYTPSTLVAALSAFLLASENLGDNQGPCYQEGYSRPVSMIAMPRSNSMDTSRPPSPATSVPASPSTFTPRSRRPSLLTKPRPTQPPPPRSRPVSMYDIPAYRCLEFDLPTLPAHGDVPPTTSIGTAGLNVSSTFGAYVVPAGMFGATVSMPAPNSTAIPHALRSSRQPESPTMTLAIAELLLRGLGPRDIVLGGDVVLRGVEPPPERAPARPPSENARVRARPRSMSGPLLPAVSPIAELPSPPLGGATARAQHGHRRARARSTLSASFAFAHEDTTEEVDESDECMSSSSPTTTVTTTEPDKTATEPAPTRISPLAKPDPVTPTITRAPATPPPTPPSRSKTLSADSSPESRVAPTPARVNYKRSPASNSTQSTPPLTPPSPEDAAAAKLPTASPRLRVTQKALTPGRVTVNPSTNTVKVLGVSAVEFPSIGMGPSVALSHLDDIGDERGWRFWRTGIA